MKVDDGTAAAPIAAQTTDARAARLGARTDMGGGAGSAGPQRRTWRVHRSSIAIVAIGLAITVTLAVVAHVGADDAATRLLDSQLRQVSAALEASIPKLQQPLIAADQIASSTRSTRAFDDFVASEVGSGAPFRAVSLWRVTRGRPTLLAMVGRSALLTQPQLARKFLSSLRPSTQLSVTGMIPGPPRGYGIAEVLPGSTDGYVVYAEPGLLPASSPVAGLDVALYLGPATAPRNLMASTMARSVSGPRGIAEVPFGASEITIVATSTRPLSSSLSSEMPWLIGALGVAVTLLAATASERLIRRRELAEAIASSTEERFEEQRDISSTLQQALLPDEHPVFPGLELATRYVAGTRGLEIGGDWYEVIALGDDRLFVTVGDVSGRGLQAATTMTYLRHAIRAYALQGDGPDVVLGKLDELLDVERDGCFATVLCGLVSVGSRSVTLASAGHPPPLVIDGLGARFVGLDVGPPVGAGEGQPPRPVTLTVGAGAALVAFTDGLVEQRGRTLDERLEELRAASEGQRGSMEATLIRIIEALVPAGADDDLAILGVKWRT